MPWHSTKRFGTCFIGGLRFGPSIFGGGFVFRQACKSLFSGSYVCRWCIRSFQIFDFLGRCGFVSLKRGFDILEFVAKFIGLGLECSNHFFFLRVVNQLFFFGRHFFKLVAVDGLWNWNAGLLN